MKLTHQRLVIKRAMENYRAHPTPENHRIVMRAITEIDKQRKESSMKSVTKKIACVLCVVALCIIAACDPYYTSTGNTSANAGTGSGTGGYCGSAQGVASK